MRTLDEAAGEAGRQAGERAGVERRPRGLSGQVDARVEGAAVAGGQQVGHRQLRHLWLAALCRWKEHRGIAVATAGSEEALLRARQLACCRGARQRGQPAAHNRSLPPSPALTSSSAFSSSASASASHMFTRTSVARPTLQQRRSEGRVRRAEAAQLGRTAAPAASVRTRHVVWAVSPSTQRQPHINPQPAKKRHCSLASKGEGDVVGRGDASQGQPAHGPLRLAAGQRPLARAAVHALRVGRERREGGVRGGWQALAGRSVCLIRGRAAAAGGRAAAVGGLRVRCLPRRALNAWSS